MFYRWSQGDGGGCGGGKGGRVGGRGRIPSSEGLSREAFWCVSPIQFVFNVRDGLGDRITVKVSDLRPYKFLFFINCCQVPR